MRNTPENFDIDREFDLYELDREIEIDEFFEDETAPEEPTQIYEIPAERDEEAEAEEEAVEAAKEAKARAIRRKKHRKLFLVYGVLAALSAAAVALILASPLFMITSVEVEGNKYYTDEQIINMSSVQIKGNLFLNAQKRKIRQNLKSDPYIKRVSVRRKLPGTIVIKVAEKEQIAALKYGDKYVVIDGDNVVLRVAKLDPEVTVIEGMTIENMEQGKEIEVEEDQLFGDTIDMLEDIREGDLYFKRIVMSKTNIKAYIYDTLLVRGHPRDMTEAIRSGSLRKVLGKLFKQKIDHGTIILGENGYISFSPII